MKKPFKFGERVIVSRNSPGPSGPGRIWERDENLGENVGVRFDKKFQYGHKLFCSNRHCACGYGWYVQRQYIRRAPKKA